MNKVKTYVKDWKKEKVKELTNLVEDYSVVGLLNLKDLPSDQFQTIRHKLRRRVLIKASKKAFIKRALENAGHDDLVDEIKGIPALLLTDLNPFEVNNLIQENKSDTVIKPGEEAPYDLKIEKGETQFQAGPIIGEFGELDVKARIKQGKIHIMKTTTIVPEGEEASPLAASMLSRLGLKPMEITLNLVAIKDEDGIIYDSDVLNISVEERVSTAYTHAKNFVLNTGMLIPELIKEVLQKGRFQALLLNGVVNPEEAVQPRTTRDETESEEEDEEDEVEDEMVSEEEAAEGLGTLFG